MKLTVIGCSGSFAGPQSPASCYLVQAEHEGRTWNLLVDLGNGALGALQKWISLSDIDGIFISHLHPDHCLDLCGLFVVQRFNPDTDGPVRRIPVFGPQDTAARIARANGVSETEAADVASLDAEFEFHTVTSAQSFVLGPFTLTPHLVNHPVEAYGVRVEADGKVLTYTGDTDACDALVPLMTGADLVLADSAFCEGRDEVTGIHLTGRRAALAAVAAGGVRRLMLTHIPPWNDPLVCRSQAAEVWPGEVELAAPAAEYEI